MMKRSNATVMFVLISLTAGLFAQEPAGTPVLHDARKPFVFGFLGWEKARTAFAVTPEGIHIITKDSKGGGGLVAGGKLALDPYAQWSPALVLKLREKNQARTIHLLLQDADGTGYKYRFDLSKLKPGAAQTLLPEHGASLSEPGEIEKPGKAPGLDLANVSGVMIIGDFSNEPVDVVLSKVTLTPPNDELRAERTKLKELRAKAAAKAIKEAQAKEQARQDLLAKGAKHLADGPQVTHVGAVAPDVLAVTLQAGQHVSNRLEPYIAQPGDEVVEDDKGKGHQEVVDGAIVRITRKSVFRKADGKKREKVGSLSPDGKMIFIESASTGALLEETIVDLPESYTIQSADDAAFAQPMRPVGVFRKGKPNGFSKPLPFLYTISLRLPAPLKEGATYTIRFFGVNTAQESITYTHTPRQARSLAIHAIQTGYRPDDPYKRAYVSFWMGIDKEGKNGSCTPAVEAFELIDGSGKTVFAGKAERSRSEGDLEQISIHEKADYTRAAVYRLDFSAFNTPGEYRIFIPGIGTSGPLRITADVWEQPFKTAMTGIFTQRQGIALGPPASAYTRPRTFHPDDGVQFYSMSIPMQGGQEAGEGGQAGRGGNLSQLASAGKLQRISGVWGGYQDAGDWDTLSHHLSATYDLLGLYDLNPAAFKTIKLSLPPEEANNNLPDILDEALWQMPCWRRLQQADGGVRGGYGYGWGCPGGTTSAMIKSAGVYAADPVSTYHYAGVAARTARVLGAFDAKQAKEYLDSAQRAWAWAEAHSKEDDAIYQQTAAFARDLRKSVNNFRAQAAVELLAVTRDPVFDAAFKESSELSGKAALYMEQPGANFAYARLPEGLGDAALKKEAVKSITTYADHAIAFSGKNAFDLITGHRTDMPMIFVARFFSTPGAAGMAHIHAYELTEKPEYLRAIVQSSNYCLGANPDNLSYCTGVGYNTQHFAFIVDAQVTGQQPDKIIGHIPYGQGNEGNEMSRKANGWVQQWLLNFAHAKKMTPNWFDWPAHEQYIDFARYPLHNENCFNQTTVPAAVHWFYLASRQR